jgi:hypothetical protein
MTCPVHGQPAHTVIPRPNSRLGSRLRCQGCGHRVTCPDGTPPGSSRRLPIWTWPVELVDRWLARRMPPALPDDPAWEQLDDGWPYPMVPGFPEQPASPWGDWPPEPFDPRD